MKGVLESETSEDASRIKCRPFVCVLQPLSADVGIVLCRIQTAVTKQLFHCIDVRPSVQEVGGERMPDDVWAALVQRARLRNIVVNPAVNKRWIELSTAIGYNQDIAYTGASTHVLLGHVQQIFRDGNQTLSTSLSGHLDGPSAHLNICVTQLDELILSDARLVEQGHHESVSKT